MTRFCLGLLWSCIVFSSVSVFCNTYPTADWMEERELFKQAVKAYERGNISTFRKIKEQLNEYSLSIYLDYYDELRFISSTKPNAAIAIRKKWANSRFGEKYFSRWLRRQAELGRWTRFIDYYERHEDVSMQCYYLRALYATGRKQDALDGVPKLWIVGRSQPKVCDSIFNAWITHGRITEKYVEERFNLALQNNSLVLVGYLLQLFKDSNRSRASLLYDTHRQPDLVLKTTRYRDDRWGRKAVLHGLSRLLRSRGNADLAHSAWQKYRTKFSFSEYEKNEMDGKIAAVRAFSGHISSTVKNEYPQSDREQIAIAGISASKWQSAMDWIQTLTKDQRDEFRWQYWHGRVGMFLNRENAMDSLIKLAKLRTYYGFAAAHALGIEPSMNLQTTIVGEAIEKQFINDVRIARIFELYAINDLTNARREINWIKYIVPDAYLKRLVIELHQAGWYEQAIFHAGDAGLLDALEVRFPRPFNHIYQKYADVTNLPVSLLFAVSRQESAFNESAVSPASARGVMQLMLDTAKHTARRIGAPTPTTQTLLDPEVSIRLGSHHLAELMQKYDNHRIIVAAAYNAGVPNAERWLKNASGMDSLAWIERITYRETRSYIKSVLAFNQVYNSLLGLSNMPFIAPHEQSIP